MRFSFAESMTDPHVLRPPRPGRRGRPASTPSWCPTASATRGTRTRPTPTRDDGNRAFLEDKPFIEPFSLIPALGAVTERLRFTTFVVKLPIRNPVLVAKQAASVAVLTDNRFGFGVGLSPWPEDYVICDRAVEGPRSSGWTSRSRSSRQLNAGGYMPSTTATSMTSPP